jgi:hypothetical protein
MDCIEYHPGYDIDLIMTDAPHKDTLSTDEVIIRLDRLCPKIVVVCKDEIVTLCNKNITLVQRKHVAFSGNLFEKMKFAAHYIREYTKPEGVVLDPFCGYSSTGVAAVGLNRRYIGIDNKQDAIDESERILTKVVLDGRC